jgi:NAD(P)H-dependent flavin oxidoreductase YrpB (nitropropane dioxygenase family)
MVAAVSDAGGFGIQGCHQLNVAQIHDAAAAIRSRTSKPFALNFLMFLFEEDCFAAALREKPAAIALAWPRPEQDLKHYIDRAHDAGCKVSLMAGGDPKPSVGLLPVPTSSLPREPKVAVMSDGWQVLF